MKKLLLVLGLVGLMAAGCNDGQIGTAASTFTPNYPEPTGYVIDTAHILDFPTTEKLKTELANFDSKAQVAVVTVPTTGELDIEAYSIGLADKFKPGYKGKDNGIIFLIAYNDHHMRIEVGRGLEGQLTDSQAAHILDNTVKPLFKAGKYNEGVLAGVDEIMKGLK